jgi:hypothetical protein
MDALITFAIGGLITLFFVVSALPTVRPEPRNRIRYIVLRCKEARHALR